jgi:soluble lytic murein transglycosylase-like protein
MNVDSNLTTKPAFENHSSSAAPAKHGSFWSEFISRAAQAAGIDPKLALHVAIQESGLNPHAVNPTSGAVGMMQIMPGTANDLGINPHDAAANIRGGIAYLSQQLSHFGDTVQALAAYNWGPGNVAGAIAKWGESWLAHAPRETQAYVDAILHRTGHVEDMPSAKTVAHASAPAQLSPALSSARSIAGALNSASVRKALQMYLFSELLG